MIIWLDTWGAARALRQRMPAAERTRSRRHRAGTRRNKRLHTAGRFLTDINTLWADRGA